jgi:hypothetical protein
MRLIRLALALVAMSTSWAASANPAVNSNVSGSIAGAVGASVVSSTAAAQVVSGQSQVRLDGGLGSNLGGSDARSRSRSSSAGGIDESVPRGWLMALVAVLLIGHQLRRKHRFLRPHRFSDF